jgi:hypothetical protein
MHITGLDPTVVAGLHRVIPACGDDAVIPIVISTIPALTAVVP